MKCRVAWILIAVSALLLAAGAAGLARYPGGVRRESHRAHTADGVSIAYDLYRPGTAASPAPVVVIGHGVVINKEMMASLALELAAGGCIVAAFDWRGHGGSGGRLGQRDGLALDLATVIADVPRRLPAADMARLALAGFSMGGPPTFRYAAEHDTVRAWVGLGTFAPPGLGGPDRPRNVLLLIGDQDEAFTPERVRASLDNLIPDGPVAFGRRYGALADGTAREVARFPGVDHLVTPYHGGLLLRARDWILESVGRPIPPSGALGSRLAWLVLGLAGLTGLLYGLAAVPRTAGAPRSAENPPAPIPARTVLARTALSLLGWPAALLFLPLAAAGLPFSALTTALAGGCAVSLALTLRRPASTAGRPLGMAFRNAFGGGWRVWARAMALAMALAVGALVLIGPHWMGITPGPDRWTRLPLFALPLLGIALFFALYIQKLAGPSLAAWLGRRSGRPRPVASCWLAAGLLFGWFAALILAACLLLGNFFFAMVLFPLAPMLAALALVGAPAERTTGSVLPAALANALVWTLAVVTLSPAMDMSRFF
jgi:dienelactone hydrolase